MQPAIKYPINTVYYKVRISPELDGVKYSYFAELCAEILAEDMGWKKYGFKFVNVDKNAAVSAVNDEYKPSKVNKMGQRAFYTNAKTPLTIYLTTSSKAGSMCNLPGFSCWRQNHNDIIINAHNWEGGSKSQLPVDLYRKYVINHEMGHALGLNHNKCQIEECRRRNMITCPASVMQQMTRGPAAIAPCVEAYYPLDSTWEVDDPHKHGDFARKHTGGSWQDSTAIYIIILFIIIFVYNVAFAPTHTNTRSISSDSISARNNKRDSIIV